MGEIGLDRRQLLSGAGLAAGAVAVGSFALASPATADDNNGGGSLAGSWMVKRQSDNDPTDKATAVFSLAGGNVIIVHDINPAGPPFTGTWARKDDHRFRATFFTGNSGGGPGGPPGPPPVLRVHVEGQVQQGTISGMYTLTVLDAGTNETLFSDTGTFSGPRINA
jgi:hypothetical protein